ncbi:hypothetical protein SAMN05444166_4198 [Singulisphaera sp. GP187]|uniref:hypothetical protein n=1 Tax=Singulisphaera sp. GP187 TaxID=1882752 RepID=UPI0009274D09|nr:hypothetical protein [Singulisphaera sp. GP187]SIO37527.1 hypothetical protein SAMN05444166_4198 [Singulisphaera sp. GP187]
MIITNHTEHAELGQPFWRLLCSDFHLGSACSDHDAIVRQLQRAKDVGARVLINGDMFDAIGPKDRRFDLSVLHPLVARKKDLAKAIVDMAMEILMPFKDIIDIIGIGNHEETWINYGYNDPVRRVLEELAREGGKAKHGSFWGYIKTSFVVPGHRKRPKHKLLYLHGTGGDSPVTKGTIDFNRKGRNWVYDCLTFGHKHNMVCAADQIADVSDKGRYVERRQLNLQTASYYRNYRQLKDDEVLDQSYAARSAHPPKPIGGVFLCLRPDSDPDTGELVIRQDFMSDVIFPMPKRRKTKPIDPQLQEKDQAA